MPRVFIHLHEPSSVTADEEGVDVTDLDAARAKAVHEARSIMSADVADGRLCLISRIVVTDEAGKPLAEVSFKDVIELVLG